METLYGTAGDDTLTGTAADEYFSGSDDLYSSDVGFDVAALDVLSTHSVFSLDDFYYAWRVTSAATGSDTAGYFMDALQFNDGLVTLGQFNDPATVIDVLAAGNSTSSQVQAMPTGGYLHAWNDGNYVHAQRLDDQGNGIGAEIQVGYSYNPYAGNTVSLAVLADASYVIAWQGYGGINTQRCSENGVRIGTENYLYTNSNDSSPVLAALAGGGYAVAWIDTYGTLLTQRYDNAGIADGNTVTLATSVTELHRAAGGIADGFAVTYGQNGYGVTSTLLLHADDTTETLAGVPVALAGGGYVVATAGYGWPSTQFFGSDGALPGSSSWSTTYSSVTDISQVIALTGGGYVIAWNDGVGGTGAQCFDASGSATGWEIHEPSGTVTLTALGDGGFLVNHSDDYYPYNHSARFDSAGFQVVAAGELSGDANDNAIEVQGPYLDVAISGFDGNDTLESASGNDTLDGGNGDDKLIGSTGSDSLDGGDGSDTLIGGDGNDWLFGGMDNVADSLSGGNGADTLVIGYGNDTLAGGAGNDRYVVDGPNDPGMWWWWTTATIADGSGNDTLEFINLNGDLWSSSGIENAAVRVTAASAYSYFFVEGNDLDNRVYGILDGGTANFELNGYGGDDTLLGEAFSDEIDGGSGRDWLIGGDGDDTLDGGDGADTLAGGQGVDTLIGGAGNDRYVSIDMGDTYIEASGGGIDTVTSVLNWYDAPEFTLADNIENLEATAIADGYFSTVFSITGNNSSNLITLTSGNGSSTSIAGGGGNDTIYGGSGPGDFETLGGGSGNDQLYAGDGHDYLDGGAGIDVMTGGLGNDFYVLDNPGDTVVEYYDEFGWNDHYDQYGYLHIFGGNDTVSVVGFDYSVEISGIDIYGGYGKSGVENIYGYGDAGLALTYTGNWRNNLISASGDAAFTLIGGDGNDTLTAGNGADSLSGGYGADSLDGGAGNDTLAGGSDGYVDTLAGGSGNDVYFLGSDGTDIVSEISSADGNDTVDVTGISYALTSTLLENLVAHGTDGQSLTLAGNAGNNIISGMATSNTARFSLVGAGGNDSLVGSAGRDTLDGGLGADTLNSGNGNDRLLGGTGNDSLVAGVGHDRLFGDDGNDTLLGQMGLDSLVGGNGADRLDGGAENDTLLGDAGQDQLLGGDGNDQLWGGLVGDTLSGGKGNDRLYGEDGNDRLCADAGFDTLVGGTGNDVFFFSHAFATDGVENIGDFVSGIDKIEVLASVTNLVTGQLAAARFVTGAAATDSNDRFIYDSTSGNFYYDPDGTGVSAQVQVATFTGAAPLLASDIVIV